MLVIFYLLCILKDDTDNNVCGKELIERCKKNSAPIVIKLILIVLVYF